MHVPCLTWIAAGTAKQNPDRLKISPEELQQLIAESAAVDDQDNASASDDDWNNSIDESTKTKSKDDIDDQYDMDNYDDDVEGSKPIKGLETLVSYMNVRDDPLVNRQDSDADSEAEDLELSPEDNLLVVGRIENQGEYANIEVHVHNASTKDYYVHHDYLLGTFPLCMEPVAFDPGVEDCGSGNLLAIGTMEPVIELWDLDLVDSMEPAFYLGAKPELKKKKKKSNKDALQGHTDAVLDLSWNKLTTHVLASASADQTVGLWDLSEAKLVSKLQNHQEKVQVVEWHPREAHYLLSADFDGKIHLTDARSQEGSFLSWNISGEIESATWDSNRPFYFLACSDSGGVSWFDTRKPGVEIGSITEAHEGGCHSMTLTDHLMITCGADGKARVWKQPTGVATGVGAAADLLLAEKSLNLGALLCAKCNPNHPFVCGFGGEKGMALWDVRSNSNVQNYLSACGLSEEDVQSSKKMDLSDDDVDDNDDE